MKTEDMLSPEYWKDTSNVYEGGEAKRNVKSNNVYDYTKSFEEQLDDWVKGLIPQKDSLIVGPTPDVLQKIGFNALPVTINQTHVDYAINNTKDIDHYITKPILEQLPKAIKCDYIRFGKNKSIKSITKCNFDRQPTEYSVVLLE